MKEMFRKLAGRVSAAAGSVGAFIFAFGVVVGWLITGPIFQFSNTWQLFINTFTTIGTFLMVFLIQNTQNRDAKAMQLKLDELIRATRARDAFVDLEDLEDDDLDALDAEFKLLHEAQQTSPLMVKLHKKIKDAHVERKSVRSQVGEFFHRDRQ